MSTSASQALEIDWGSATVDGSTLTLELTGKAPKAWNERFDAVLTLLNTGNGGWGEIGLAKSRIHVGDVQPDAASDLRHLLESVIRQVNSDFAPDDADGPAGKDPQREADEDLAAVFRSFAEPQDT